MEIENAGGDCIIFDAGSGIRELALNLKQRPGHSSGGNTYHILLSHFHWDHIQGLPFFTPAFDPRNRIVFYSTNPELRSILGGQMREPYFPIPMEGPGGFNAALEFVHLGPERRQFRIGTSTLSWHTVNPEDGKKIIYSTDTELTHDDFLKTEERSDFFTDADILVMDSQYTMGEALEKTGWGHSTFSVSVDFALNWGIKKLVLFHHEPTYTDQKISTLRQSADWYSDYAGTRLIDIVIAREGQDLIV